MLRAIGVVLLIIPLTACTSLTISQPTKGQMLECDRPVGATVNWTSNLQGSLSVTLDGSNVAQQFTINGQAATASLQMPEGSHTLQAGGNFSCWYCSGGSFQLSATSQFETDCHHHGK
jgi:hypothetical protein